MATRHCMFLRFTAAASLTLVVLSAHSQIATDGSVGSAQSLAGPNYAIGAGLGTQRGANLFHSFSTFNINTGESATFTGPSGLQNVISRVTGGALSSIDGTLRSEINGANVWLINPAGVVFGANAKLDVPAAFHVSTADELRFTDGAKFSAANPGVSTLSAAPIAAFGFTSAAPKRIEANGGFLSVKEGQALSLVGGDINLSNATIYAPAGRLNIASVGSAGEVALTETDVELRGFGALGMLTMVRDPEVERVMVDMGEPLGEVELGDLDTSGVGGGAIRIGGGFLQAHGGRISSATLGSQPGQGINARFTGDVFLENRASIRTSTLSVGNAGDINLKLGSTMTLLTSGITSFALDNSTGATGNVKINVADNLSLLNGSSISTTVRGEGHSGAVTVQSKNLLIDGQNSEFATAIGSQARWYSTGNAADVTVTVADTLSLINGGAIASETLDFSKGNSGDLTVVAETLLINGGGISTNAFTAGAGNAGTVAVIADTLLISPGEISSDTWGSGDAGSIMVQARNLLVDGQGSGLATAISSAAFENEASSWEATGNAGDVTVTVTDTLSLFNGGSIGTSTWGAGNAGRITVQAQNLLVDGSKMNDYFTGIVSNSYASGSGGAIIINVADTFSILNGGQISVAARANGNAGSMIVSAGQALNIAGGFFSTGWLSPSGIFFPSGLFASSSGTGNAGDIFLTTHNLTLSDGSAISARSDKTTGGNLFINAADLRLLNGGHISTSVFGDETTTGGNVEINSRTVLALDGSKITAKAKQGKGGNILVNADVFLHNAASIDDVLNASSESVVTGNQGSVTVNTAIDPARSVVGINRRLGDLNDANQDPCARRKGQKKSTLTKVGRGGLPADNRPEGMTVSLSGGDWTVEPVEPAPSLQEPLALNADRDDCRL